jgi:hypothetical protein
MPFSDKTITSLLGMLADAGTAGSQGSASSIYPPGTPPMQLPPASPLGGPWDFSSPREIRALIRQLGRNPVLDFLSRMEGGVDFNLPTSPLGGERGTVFPHLRFPLGRSLTLFGGPRFTLPPPSGGSLTDVLRFFSGGSPFVGGEIGVEGRF